MSAAPADFGDNDDIFADRGPPLGADPFALNEAQIIEGSAATLAGSVATPPTGAQAVVAVAKLGLRHELPFSEILTNIAATTAREAGGTQALFFEHSLSDGTTTARSAGASLAPGEGFVAFATQAKCPVWSDEARDPGLYFQWLTENTGITATRCVALPVFIQERCFGCIEIYDPALPRDSALDARLMALAEAAAVAVETRLLLAQYMQTEDRMAA